MDSFSNINIQAVQRQVLLLYNHRFFEYIVAFISISLAFLFGRLFHQKKFTNLLSMINDAQTTRKKINSEKNSIQNSVKNMESKKYLFLSLLFVVSAAIGASTYFVKKIDIHLLTKIVIGLVIIVAVIWGRLKYLRLKKKSLQNKLKQTQLTTQNQIKAILSQIGPEIQKSLKFKLQREIQENLRKQQMRQCQLSKCSNEKRTYYKLYLLYKTMITEMTKLTWCAICSSQSNINAMDLAIHQLDSNLNLYRKLASDPKFLTNTQKSKELTNKMLQQWSDLEPKLEFVCKRGCCIKFRQIVEGLKKQHFRGLNELKASLRAN